MATINAVNSKFTLRADTPQHIKDFFLRPSLDVPEELGSDEDSIGILSFLRGCCGCYKGWDKHYVADVHEDGSISIEARISRKRIWPEDVLSILTLLQPYLKAEPFDILSKVSFENCGSIVVLTWGPTGAIDEIELLGYYESEFGYVIDCSHPSNFSGIYDKPWTYVPFYEQYKARRIEEMTHSFG